MARRCKSDLPDELNHSMLRKLMFQGPGQTEMILQRTYYGKHLVPLGKKFLLTQEQQSGEKDRFRMKVK
jgi:hypothetical protein